MSDKTCGNAIMAVIIFIIVILLVVAFSAAYVSNTKLLKNKEILYLTVPVRANLSNGEIITKLSEKTQIPEMKIVEVTSANIRNNSMSPVNTPTVQTSVVPPPVNIVSQSISPVPPQINTVTPVTPMPPQINTVTPTSPQLIVSNNPSPVTSSEEKISALNPQTGKTISPYQNFYKSDDIYYAHPHLPHNISPFRQDLRHEIFD